MPATDANGAAYAQFGFRVQDDGGADDGGADLDPALHTMTIAVTPVNDPPTFTTSTSVLPQSPSVVRVGELLDARDIDTAPAQLRYSVSAVENARIELAAAPGVAVSTFTQADVNAGRLTLVYGDTSRVSFTVVVSDGTLAIGPFTVTLEVQAALTPQTVAVVDATAMTVVQQPTSQAPTTPDSAPPAPPPASTTVNTPTTVNDVATTAAALTTQQQGRTQLAQEAAAIDLQGRSAAGPGRTYGIDIQAANASFKVAIKTSALNTLAQAFSGQDEARAQDTRSVARTAIGEALRSRDVLRELDEVRRSVEQEPGTREKVVVGSSVALSAGISIGYVLWLVRSGVLLGSVLSTLPAWQTFDPLPVLDAFKDGAAAGDGDDDAVEDIFGQRGRIARTPPVAPPPSTPDGVLS